MEMFSLGLKKPMVLKNVQTSDMKYGISMEPKAREAYTR